MVPSRACLTADKLTSALDKAAFKFTPVVMKPGPLGVGRNEENGELTHKTASFASTLMEKSLDVAPRIGRIAENALVVPALL